MLLWIKISANSRRNSVGRVRMIDEGRHTKVSFSSVFLHTGSFAQNFFQTDLIKRCTCKSLSEALILASTNPQYDNRLFIELQVKYMKIPSSNLGRICCVQKLFCKKKSFWQRFTCTKVLRKLGGRHMSSLLGSPPTRSSLLTQFMCLVRAKWCINICRSDFNCHPTRVPNVYHMDSQSCDTFIWLDT